MNGKERAGPAVATVPVPEYQEPRTHIVRGSDLDYRTVMHRIACHHGSAGGAALWQPGDCLETPGCLSGCCCRCCIGPPGPPGPACEQGGLQAQLTVGKMWEAGAPARFNTLRTDQSHKISYTPSSGSITLSPHGVYLVHWSASLDLPCGRMVRLGLYLGDTLISESDAYLQRGQLTDDALVTVSGHAGTLQLRNVGAAAITLDDDAPVMANIVVTEVG